MPTPSSEHPLVRAVTGDYLAFVDAEAPGLVEGLYLTGSVALDDFRPAHSDIDFVAVTADKPGPHEIAALRRAHARLVAKHKRPHFDGAYVTWAELAADTEDAAPGPHAFGNGFQDGSSAERHPVTWRTIVQCGVGLRGPSPAGAGIFGDPDGLESWTVGNLGSYWRPLWTRMSRLPSADGLAALTTTQAAWAVLGVTRLHHTLTTGRITSKTGAGAYALATFEERWHRIVADCVRIRSGGGSGYRNPYRRRTDVLAYTDMVIRDALALR